MTLPVYEASSVIITWNTITFKGFAPDTFLTIEPLAEEMEFTFGADSVMAPSKISNKGATITATLLQTSETNKELAAVSAAQNIIGASPTIGVFSVIDPVGQANNFVTLNAMLASRPGHSYGNAVGEKTWTWVCESYIETDDPASVTAAISDYLK
jgi:hypothetical protein